MGVDNSRLGGPPLGTLDVVTDGTPLENNDNDNGPPHGAPVDGVTLGTPPESDGRKMVH